MKGSIRSRGLSGFENSSSGSNVRGLKLSVSGSVTGNIRSSDKVELKSDGRMTGDIKAPRILIADGAVFKGNVDMDR